jgi:hypothetical protein
VAQLSTFGDISSFLFPKHAYALHMLSIGEIRRATKICGYVHQSVDSLWLGGVKTALGNHVIKEN